MGDLKGREILIIGGSRGIGLGVAKAAIGLGAKVTIASRNSEDSAKDIGAVGEKVDAMDEKSIASLFERVGAIDHLVCTQHNGSPGILTKALAAIDEIDLDVSRDFMLSKYWSQFMCLKIGAPKVSEKGSITLTSGAASRRYAAHHAVIGPCNRAIEGLAMYGTRELAPKRVNVISPGLVETPIYDDISPDLWPQMAEQFSKINPVGRVANTDDAAHAYVYSMTADYVAGSVLDIDGGFFVS